MPYYKKRRYARKPRRAPRKPYYKKKAMGNRRKYTGVKYFVERVQLTNLFINSGGATQGQSVQVTPQTDLANITALSNVFDLFSISSIKYEIRPINSYTFGTSPVPAPQLTYALEENVDNWAPPNSKVELLQKGTSRTRSLDTQKTSVITMYQKLPASNATEQEVNNTSVGITIIQPNRRKFQWYSLHDIMAQTTSPVNFGALRCWMELPTGSTGQSALDVAEVYATVRYCMKEQA